MAGYLLNAKRSRLSNKNSRLLLKCYANKNKLLNYSYKKEVPILSQDDKYDKELDLCKIVDCDEEENYFN